MNSVSSAKKISKTEGKTDAWRLNSSDFGRKYRPKFISELIGQSMVKYAIKGMVKKKHIPGALLIHGQRGCGKTTITRVLTAIINCKQLTKNGDPCMECESCKALWSSDQIKHPDYIEINCAADTSIDGIRALKERLSYKPRNNAVVVVLDEVHKLSKAAQEAALKIIEEPNNHVRWILATTDIQGIIATLLSRCTKLQLTVPSLKEVVGLLQRVCKSESLSVSDDVLEALVTSSNNIPRDSLNALQRLALIIASGEIKAGEVTMESLSSDLAEAIGVPNYACIRDFLIGVYKGRLSACVVAANSSQNKTTMLKGCLDTHTSVVMFMSTKKPEEVFQNKQSIGYMKHIVSTAGLPGDADTRKLMSLFLNDMLDMYAKSSQYQFGDSVAPLVGLASRWCLRFKQGDA